MSKCRATPTREELTRGVSNHICGCLFHAGLCTSIYMYSLQNSKPLEGKNTFFSLAGANPHAQQSYKSQNFLLSRPQQKQMPPAFLESKKPWPQDFDHMHLPYNFPLTSLQYLQARTREFVAGGAALSACKDGQNMALLWKTGNTCHIIWVSETFLLS